MIKKFSSIIKSLATGTGPADMFAFLGLGIMTWGIWRYSMSNALIVLGFCLMAVGFYSSLPKGKK